MLLINNVLGNIQYDFIIIFIKRLVSQLSFFMNSNKNRDYYINNLYIYNNFKKLIPVIRQRSQFKIEDKTINIYKENNYLGQLIAIEQQLDKLDKLLPFFEDKGKTDIIYKYKPIKLDKNIIEELVNSFINNSDCKSFCDKFDSIDTLELHGANTYKDHIVRYKKIVINKCKICHNNNFTINNAKDISIINISYNGFEQEDINLLVNEKPINKIEHVDNINLQGNNNILNNFLDILLAIINLIQLHLNDLIIAINNRRNNI